MLASLVFPLLAAAVQACPLHTSGGYEYPVDESKIAAANQRKRDTIPRATEKIAITNVYVFDGFERSNKTSTVVIDGSVIGNSNDTAGATLIDGHGGTLMPGLFDSHTHATTLDDLNALTEAGVTSTLIMSCWKASDLCASLRNQPGLTDIRSSGHSALVYGSDHARLTNATLDETITNTSMCSDWVQSNINNGSDFIKLVAESTEPTMSQDEHNAIVKAAHDSGLKTATHASSWIPYLTAINSNSDFIQHSVVDTHINTTTASRMLEQNIHVTPTVNIYQHAQTAYNLSDQVIASWMSNIAYNTKFLYDAGVPILAGTDSSLTANGPAIIPFGSSLHLEMEMLVGYGLPTLEVLRAATSRPALVYGMLDRGMITPGLRADLVLVDGNPLVNISKTREIERVWVTGIEYTGE